DKLPRGGYSGIDPGHRPRLWAAACGNVRNSTGRCGMYRHGDVLVAPVDEIPSEARKRPNCILAEGEITGHSHRIDEPGAAELYADGGQLYLRVLADRATLVHDEHHPISLPQGIYRVWRQ